MATAEQPTVVCSGDVQVDLQTGELHVQGKNTHLQEKPLQVLRMLLERPGELVTREALQERLWGGETFVVFDDNLNHAVKRLRKALGDCADAPQYVETVPRQGYRFVSPVSVSRDADWQESLLIRRNTSYPMGRTSTLWQVLPWVVAAVMALAAAVMSRSLWTGTDRHPLAVFEIPIPGEYRTPNVVGIPLALSPDGRYLAYVAGHADQVQLYLRALDQYESTLVVGAEGAHAPFFSPDGQWLGFFTENALYKVRVSGGSPVKICNLDTYPNRGASWGGDDIIFFSHQGAGLWRVSAGGGTPEKVEPPAPCRWPQVLPGGEHILCSTAISGSHRTVIWSPATDEWRILEVGKAGARYISSGHLVFGSAGTLMAVPFDLSRLEVAGTQEAIVGNVRMHPYDLAYAAVSNSGTLAYVPGCYESKLTRVDREGQGIELVRVQGGLLWPRFSPDGRRVAVHIMEEDDFLGVIWVYDLDRDTWVRIGPGYDPIWTTDGTRITFAGFEPDGDRTGICSKSADGTGEAELLWEEWGRPLSWSPDGQTLAFQKGGDGTRADIWIYHVDGEAEPLIVSEFEETDASFSPDGHWLAYVSDESGRNEVYVQPYPGPGGRWPVSSGGGVGPVWSPDGREIFYRDPTGQKLLVTTFRGLSSVQIGTPQLLFDRPYYAADGRNGRNFDLAPDGQHFLVIESTGSRSIHIALHWFEELKRLGPTED